MGIGSSKDNFLAKSYNLLLLFFTSLKAIKNEKSMYKTPTTEIGHKVVIKEIEEDLKPIFCQAC